MGASVSKIVPADHICTLCARYMFNDHTGPARDRLALVVHSSRVFHQRCFQDVFGQGAVPGVMVEALDKRELCMESLAGPIRYVYVVAIAVSLFAFGIFSALARAIIVTVASLASAYLIARGLDYYVRSHTPRKVQFT